MILNTNLRRGILCLVAICLSTSLSVCSASIIYDASGPTDTNIVGNGFNLSSNTLTGTTGSLTLETVAAPGTPGNTSGHNNASGLASASDIDTLLGTPLLVTDTVTMKLGVTNTTGVNNLRANGIEFGLSPDGTGFRPAPNLIFQIDADNDNSGMAIGNIPGLALNVAGWAVTEASLADGFCVTLVADSAGYTFTLTDIEQVGNLTNTTLSYSNTFAGTEFIDNFGGGHIYYTRQGSNGTVDVNINEFSIDVMPLMVPEPSSVVLIFLGAVGFFVRRRR